jgi:hypothetical protein
MHSLVTDMLTRDQKLERYESFIRSKKFGEDTLRTVHLFGFNVVHSMNTIELYFVLIKRLNEGDIKMSNATKGDQVRVMQHVYLDMIMKIEILIESTLVLIYSLSQSYQSVPQNMTNYSIQLVYEIIKKIRKRSKDMNMRRILALPNPAKLKLDHHERKLLLDVYDKTEDYFWKRLVSFADFYDRFRIVYGKSKHGLTMQTGLSLILENNFPVTIAEATDVEKSFLRCLDRKSQSEMPKGSIDAQSSDVPAGEYYNVVTHVNFNCNLIEYLKQTMRELRNLVTYICHNHITYATNCGEGYLPYDSNLNEANSIMVKFYSDTPVDANYTAKCQAIFDKVSPSINRMQLGIDFLAEYGNLKDTTREALLKDPVTNFWIQKVSPI